MIHSCVSVLLLPLPFPAAQKKIQNESVTFTRLSNFLGTMPLADLEMSFSNRRKNPFFDISNGFDNVIINTSRNIRNMRMNATPLLLFIHGFNVQTKSFRLILLFGNKEPEIVVE